MLIQGKVEVPQSSPPIGIIAFIRTAVCDAFGYVVPFSATIGTGADFVVCNTCSFGGCGHGRVSCVWMLGLPFVSISAS